ncbi:MAG: hypothetical protein Q4Q04_04775, partial [Methanocorpusculum sp.]|nr:hypothetical protein [Methanocorpusculum sp.]
MDNTTLWDKIADFFSTEAGNGNILGITVYGDVTVGNILAVIIIAIVTYTIARAVTNIIRRILVGKVDLNNITFFAKLVRWLIYFLGFLVASPQLHIDFSGLMVAGGVVA